MHYDKGFGEDLTEESNIPQRVFNGYFGGEERYSMQVVRDLSFAIAPICFC